MNLESNILQIPIEEVIPNRFQPRLNFDEKGLEELANSIKQHGIIQPLVVRRIGDKYEIIAGERRYKAAVMCGLKRIPAVVAQIDDNKSAEVAIVENVQRRDLSPIEEARSYKSILDKGYTQSELAKKLGISQSAIANKLRLLNLDEQVQEALIHNAISERHARSLLILPNHDDQKMWLEKIIRERMTVKDLDEALKKALTKPEDKEYIEPDIPLVKPLDIEAIRASATNLPSVNENSEIAQKIKEIEREKMYNPDVVPVEQATNNSQGNFFNFLESETVNMNMEEQNLQTPVIDFGPLPDTNPVEALENATPSSQETPAVTNNAPEVAVSPSAPAPNPVAPSFEVTPPQTSAAPSVDITPQANLNAPTPPMESTMPNPNPTPSEPTITFTPTNVNIAKEPVSLDIGTTPVKDFTPYDTPNPEVNSSNANNFDPVSLIDTLDPTYEAQQEASQGLDLKTAINEIRTVKEMLALKGFDLTIEESDLTDCYQFVIKVKK